MGDHDSFFLVHFKLVPLLHSACPRDGWLDGRTDVRKKGQTKNSELGSGETSGVRGGNEPPPCSAGIVVAFIS